MTPHRRGRFVWVLSASEFCGFCVLSLGIPTVEGHRGFWDWVLASQLGRGAARVAHTDRVAHAQKELKFAFSRESRQRFSFATQRKDGGPHFAQISKLAMRATSRRLRSLPIERSRFHCGLALARPLDVSRREHHRNMRNFHRRCGVRDPRERDATWRPKSGCRSPI